MTARGDFFRGRQKEIKTFFWALQDAHDSPWWLCLLAGTWC